MRWMWLFILLVGFISSTYGQLYRAYDCRRANSRCLNNGNCRRTGQEADIGRCSCQNNVYGGNDCGLVLSGVGQTTCNPTCQNGGVCYRPSPTSAYRCYCDPIFTGPRCSLRKVRILSCTSTTLTAVILPYTTSSFQGRIYVKGHSRNSLCQFTPSTDSLNPGYIKQLTFPTGDCTGPGSVTTTQQNGMTTITYHVIVEHSPDPIQVYTDEEHMLNCTLDPSGSATVSTVSIDVVSGAGGGGTSAGGSVPGIFDLRITRYPDRQPISGPVVLGTDLYLEARPTGASAVSDFRMTSCVARGPGTEVVTLIAERCILPIARDYGVVTMTKVGSEISMHFKAFKFNSGTNMAITCQFAICTSSADPTCTVTRCNGNEFSFGRRRRQASTESHPNMTVQLYVVGNANELGYPEQRCPTLSDQDVCFHVAGVVTVVSLFVLLLLVAFMLLVFVCLRMRSRESTKEANAYTNDYVNDNRV